MSPNFRHICIVFIVLALCATLTCVYWAFDSQEDLAEYEKNVNYAIALGNELRLDVILQGNYARTLVIKGEDMVVENSLAQITAQNKGDAPRPMDAQLFPGMSISIQKIIDSLHIPDTMKAMLSEAYKTSLVIANRDLQAVRTAQGVYLDATGLYSIEGEPDVEQAKELVFNAEYAMRLADFNTLLTNMDELLLRDMAVQKADISDYYNTLMFAATLSFFLAIILFSALSLRSTGPARLMQTYTLVMICLVVLVAGPSFMLFTDLEPFVKKVNVTRIEGMTQLAIHDLQEKIFSTTDLFTVLAKNQNITNFMTNYRASPTFLEQARGTLEEIRVLLRTVEGHYGNVSSFSLISLDRTTLLRTGRYDTDCTPHFNSKVMLELMDGKAQIIAFTHDDTAKHDATQKRGGLSIAVPVFRSDANKVVGILVGSLCQSNALNLWHSRVVPENGISSFTMDEHGALLHFAGEDPNKNTISVPADLRNFVKSGQTGLFSTSDMDYYLARSTNPPWYIVIGASNARVQQDVRNILGDTILYTTLAILVGIMLISMPLQQLTTRLHLSLDRLKNLIKETGMFTWEYNFKTETVSYNEQFRHLLGYEADEFLLVNSRQWLVDNVHPADFLLLQEAKKKKNDLRNITIEIRVKHASGDWIWIVLLGFNMSFEAGDNHDAMMGTGYDITARKILEQTEIEAKQHLEILVQQRTAELEESRNQAEAASKAKSEFLSTVSHEIRTPMNAIVGFTHLFPRKNLTHEQLGYLGKIQLSSDTLLNIINDVLDISKIESGKLDIEHVPFSLDVMLDSMQSIAHFSVQSKNTENTGIEKSATQSSEQGARQERSVHFNMRVPPTIPRRLVGDGKRVSQVVLNLLNNAIKFTTKGSVSLEITQHRTPALEQTHPFAASDDVVYLTFSVYDTGIGLTEEQIVKLFQPFAQADSSITRRFGGTGLGLAICKHLVELMGGTIGVRSQYGEGSCFYFSLPFAVQKAAQTYKYDSVHEAGQNTEHTHAKEGVPADISSTGLEGMEPEQVLEELKKYAHKSILVVEDNYINQEIAATILENAGLHCDLADNGQMAIGHAQEKQYDIIFMDLQMPIMGGLEASTKLRLMGDAMPWLKSVPIVAMTANVMVEDKRKCVEAGMDSHISKPIDPIILYKELLKWLSR